jgi:hypothetical protein
MELLSQTLLLSECLCPLEIVLGEGPVVSAPLPGLMSQLLSADQDGRHPLACHYDRRVYR